MEGHLQGEALPDHVRHPVYRLDQALPSVIVGLRGRYPASGGSVAVVDEHEVLRARGGRHLADPRHRGLDSRPVGRMVEMTGHGGGGDGVQAAAVELRAERPRVGGQVAVVPHLDPVVPGLDDLVEEPPPRDPVRLVGVPPHAPGVRPCAYPDAHTVRAPVLAVLIGTGRPHGPSGTPPAPPCGTPAPECPTTPGSRTRPPGPPALS